MMPAYSRHAAFAQCAPIAQQLTFTPNHASGICEMGEAVGWTVTPGPDGPTYAYKWTIRRNNAVVLKEGKFDLSSGKDTTLGSKAHGYIAKPAREGIPCDYQRVGNTDREKSYFLNMYLRVPAGTDTNGDLHGPKAGYPNWSSTGADLMSTPLYFATVNFASRIQAPVLAGMGFIDTISRPESEHDNLTPQKGRAYPARTRENLEPLKSVKRKT